ncbi:hypothetical protein [Winogradskyella sp. 3972H.M.0a.05]|uniref:hypothetical protein n=1 Tax=Winogradskyella sp. 3972H.M.0a.05 TaxID=2950277 RepID=UPI0033977543
MKKILSLFAFLFLFVAITCEDEPLDEGIEGNQQNNTSCEQATLDVADAALAFTNIIDGNYTELCTDYVNALETLIEACGDPDGSIQQAIDALGDCQDPETFNDCEAAENAANLAQINLENAPDEEYGNFCTVYIAALENQIAECGDADGSLQAIIDGLGDCSSVQNDDCEMATLGAETAQAELENATSDTYNAMCSAYIAALQEQITACGDPNGDIQAIIDDLGNCEAPTAYEIGDIGPGGGYVFHVTNGGMNGLEIAPSSTEFQTQWGCYNMAISGTSSDVGSGQANTNIILDFHNNIDFYNNPEQCQEFVNPVGVIQSTGDVAAKNCDDLVFGGKDDWYLPSIGELSLVYDNLVSQGLGDISEGAFCSSTDDDSEVRRMWVIFFEEGNTTTLWKYDLWDYRAIRSF